MDAAAITHRSARLLGPYLMVQGQTQTLTCPMYANGGIVAPTSATVSIERPDGTRLVDEDVTPINNSRATFSLLSTLLTTDEPRGARWQVIWTLVFASGVSPEIVSCDAAVIRRMVYCSVTDADLYRRVTSLNPASATVIHAESTFQDKIDLAWGQTLREILAENKRPDLITTPSALHDAVLLLALAMIFEDFATRLNEAYLPMADRFRTEYGAARQRMSYGYDAGDTGKQPATRTRRGGTLWLGGAPIT